METSRERGGWHLNRVGRPVTLIGLSLPHPDFIHNEARNLLFLVLLQSVMVQ